MPIAVEDLDLHPHPKGKQILELFFGEAAKYRDTYVLPEHCQTAQVADDFINWVTNAIKAKELELYYHSSSAKSSLDSIQNTWGMGSLYWFNNCEFDRDTFFYWIKDKKIISKLQRRGIKIKKELIEAVKYFQSNSETREKLPPKPTTNKAKTAHLRESYINEATKILKNNRHLTGPKVLDYSSLRTLIRNSGLPENEYPKDRHILKTWMPEVRKRAGVQSKHDSKKK